MSRRTESPAEDERWMRRALALAARGMGETNPNPLVGCVIVKDGRVAGEGYHTRAGRPHAEVVALDRAGARARGATLYVTLEPCSHLGRTPPCAPLVRHAGIRRVVAALRDPNPLVNGKGLALLRRAGLDVSTGVLEDDALLLNERFLVSIREGRPFVLLKAALTLDGRIATASGDSKWITSPAQRAQARWLRRLHDAVLVGSGTALADDPLLLPSPRTLRPFTRIVIDSRLRLSPTSRLARSSGPGTPVVVITTSRDPLARRRLEEAGVEVMPIGAGQGRVALGPALVALAARGFRSVMVEGGSEMLGSFLAARLVDQVALFRAPLLLGGRASRAAFGGADPSAVADALRLGPASPRVRRGSPAGFPWPRPRLFELWYPQR